ncbi:sigma-54-dependent Fis family transcriptional regulator [candidate division KSB1 bacterium]|nr:sigma-54-dependent Fis family transcriptional regulator [candidate division KSB1 bacterium]
MNKILVIDDNDSVRYSFKRLFSEPEYQISTAKTGLDGQCMAVNEHFDVVLLDVRLPDISGLAVLKEIKKNKPKAVVLIMTAFGTTETAIEAIKYGAYDYIIKPFDMPTIKSLINEALHSSHVMHTNVVLPTQEERDMIGDRIIGSSPVMQQVYKLIGRVAGSDVNVLIRGESGTGKELVARAIFQHSRRSQKPFLAVNCGAIPDTLLESELFGFERGAFTGAFRRKIGKFEQTNGGTIFLDEIGDMNQALQAKILRILQEGCFERLGGNETIEVDTRVIAATNKNLENAIDAGTFREDLYYRLKVITITLPPLRLHKEDLPELVDHFLDKHNASPQTSRFTLSPKAMDELMSYYWPGNIRELENIIRRAIVLCKGNVIGHELVREEFKSEPNTQERSRENETDLDAYLAMPGSGSLYKRVIAKSERDLLRAVLEHTQGNQVQAAKLLGISRVMLRDRITRYSL